MRAPISARDMHRTAGSREPWSSPASRGTPDSGSGRNNSLSGYRYGSSRGNTLSPKRSPSKQTAQILEAETVEVLSNSLLRMRGTVRWQHERDWREEQNMAIQQTEKSLQDRLMQLEHSLQHVAEVVHILRCTELELRALQQSDVLTPGREPCAHASFASVLFSCSARNQSRVAGTVQADTLGISRIAESSCPDGADCDLFRELALALHVIGRQYYEQQVSSQLKDVDQECSLLISAAEQDGEAMWAAVLNSVNAEWEEGGVRCQDFSRYMAEAKNQDDREVQRYVYEQELTAAFLARHECAAQLTQMRNRFSARAFDIYDRNMRRQAEEALTTVLSVADRADAFRSVPFLQHPDGKRGVLGGVGLETANAVSASSTVKAEKWAMDVYAGLDGMRLIEDSTLEKCVRYVLLTETRRGNKLFCGEQGGNVDQLVADLQAAWSSGSSDNV